MRLITHTDLDGILCAALITSVEDVQIIKFLDPATIQAGKVFIDSNDIISDLPFDKRCGMWFDHHTSNKPKEGAEFEGLFKVAPSAAQVVYDYYENPYLDKFSEAIEQTNKIDSGDVTLDMVKEPKTWFLLSNTFETTAEKKVDDDYRRYVIKLIKQEPDIENILEDEVVSIRAANVKEDFEIFREALLDNTAMHGSVALTDFRDTTQPIPHGNNYVVYSLFPKAKTSIRLMPLDEDKKGLIKLSVGHNIFFESKSTFDVGAAMKKIGGGGHQPVGGANISEENADEIVMRLIKDINEHEEG
jgi:oligoribonuclease NrnB/cAMP/cGMP phosphodiesterase (DHH superfamily)